MPLPRVVPATALYQPPRASPRIGSGARTSGIARHRGGKIGDSVKKGAGQGAAERLDSGSGGVASGGKNQDG